MAYIELIAAYGISALAVLAFIVNIVVELTKGIGFLKRIPTSAYTIVVSILLTTITYFAVIGFADLGFVWYEMLLTMVAGFIVAYIAMYGWSKLKEIWERFKK